LLFDVIWDFHLSEENRLNERRKIIMATFGAGGVKVDGVMIILCVVIDHREHK
jgi:hypothetical protein